MRYRRKHNRRLRKIIIWICATVVLVLLCGLVWNKQISAPTSKQNTSNSQKKSANSTFNRSQYSLNDPASLWAVVNKGRILPTTYIPASLAVPGIPLRLTAGSEDMHLRADAANALEKMYKAASNQGAYLKLASGYRSYYSQSSLYSYYVRSLGQALADSSSAQAGHSEHQTGLAADLEPTNRACEIQACFADLPEGKWLAANAHKYGFIIRYPKGETKTTGYEYEPWHVRYVGKALSGEMYRQGIKTMEEFFGLPTYLSYPTQSYQLN